MEWYEILVTVVGAFGGISGFIAIYNAKPKKQALELENFMKMLDEAQDERNQLRDQYNAETEKNNLKIEKLEKQMHNLETSINEKMRAINSAYRCKFPQTIDDCPVIQTINEDSAKCSKCK